MSLPVFFLALLCIQQAFGGFVFAHYMLGNAYPSDVASFGRNIALAKAAGIDGFALNIGPDDWMPDRIAKMYEAARQAGGFKLFISFDMAVLPPNGDILVNYARQYASHPASFFYQGKYFMSTFAGESVNFGESSVNLGWQRRVKDPLANAGIQICLVPSFTAMGPVDFFEKLPVLDGAFSWAGWSNGNSLKTTEEDDIYIAGAKKNGKIYMAPVSPWFFTHFSYKNWIFKSEGLYPHRWEQILKMNVPLVEIITWNDYGEAHYIGPIDGDMPPEARVWTTGFDHQAWTDLSVAYIKAYKAGSQTAIVEKESVFFWHRVHSKYADRGDGVPRPDHWDWADDDIVVHTQLLSPADITVVNGGKSQTFRANAGANTFQIPFVEGQVFVSAARDGADLGGLRSYRDIQNAGNGYNFNPAVNKFDLKSTPKPQIPPPVAPPPVNTNQPNSAFVYLGCGIDAEQRAMDPQVYQIDGMTPTKCYERCKSLGKQYFGLEYHTECYCADQPFSKGQSAEADCNTPCGGDANTICGGGWRLSVYQIKSSNPPPNPCQNVIYGSQPNTDWWFTVSGVTGESSVQMKCNGGNLISCEKNGWGDRYACAAKGNPCGGSRNAVITKSDGSGQFECPLSLPNGNREAGQEEEGQSPAPGLAGYAIALIVIAVVVVVVLIVVATYLALRNKRSTQDERF